MRKVFDHFFGGLRLWQKFALLGTLSAALLAIPVYWYFIGEQVRIRVIEGEREGLKAAANAIDILRELQRHRELSSLALGGDKAAQGERQNSKARLDGLVASFDGKAKQRLYPDLAGRWRALKVEWNALALSVESHGVDEGQSRDIHTRLLNQVLAVLDLVLAGSAMNLDPHAESHYLTQAVLAKAPALSEKLAQARSQGATLLGRAGGREERGISQQERLTLSNLIERAHDDVEAAKRDVERIVQAFPALQERLEGEAEAAAVLARKAIRIANVEVIDAKAPSYPADEYRNLYSQAIDRQFAYIGTGLGLLDERFRRQIEAIRATEASTLGFLLLVSAVSLLLAFFISRSITRPVAYLVQVMGRLADGDGTVRARLRGRGEIAALGRQFNAMVDQREALREQIQRENEQLNSSVIELLEAVAKLAQKDLTARVPVAEDITGPVADALNLLSAETAGVLAQVVEIADNVARVSQQVKAHSDTTLHAAATERHEVEQATAELRQASEAMQDIAALALSCNGAAEKAIHNTDKAQGAVLDTIQGIASIRDRIRETEKRIKRLGERSQEIGGVVNLINNIAERTHILAINASMHAASAGEAGRSFAVVAKEVQRLAESAREATSRISSLVGNIQLETADTMATMNEAISQVVNGTRLAQQAGEDMRETLATTAELVGLVQHIATSSKAQAQTTQRLRKWAERIQKSSEETYERLQDQGQQTERLVDFSGGLLESVGVFVLPKAQEASA